jgi:hypothetical protein
MVSRRQAAGILSTARRRYSEDQPIAAPRHTLRFGRITAVDDYCEKKNLLPFDVWGWEPHSLSWTTGTYGQWKMPHALQTEQIPIEQLPAILPP